MSDLGVRRRLARFRHPGTGRSLVIALSHGMLMGRVAGLAGVKTRIGLVERAIRAGVTGLILSPGQLRECADQLAAPGGPGVWLTAGWTNLWRSEEAAGLAQDYAEGTYRSVVDPQTASVLGADGCHVYLLVGAMDPQVEADDVERVARYIHRAHAHGMPVLVEAMVRGPEAVGTERDPGHVAFAARVAAELGADMLKIEYPGSGEELSRIVADVAVPVLVLGGSRRPFHEVRAEAADVVLSGAQGIVYGRNVFQADDPDRALADLVEVVLSD
ncbi:MAG: hypothetical protein GEV10_15975 [Streptosporangiales bacterium]|nr:hypothetical protein [Streptosporangiales bacterium]